MPPSFPPFFKFLVRSRTSSVNRLPILLRRLHSQHLFLRALDSLLQHVLTISTKRTKLQRQRLGLPRLAPDVRTIMVGSGHRARRFAEASTVPRGPHRQPRQPASRSRRWLADPARRARTIEPNTRDYANETVCAQTLTGGACPPPHCGQNALY